VPSSREKRDKAPAVKLVRNICGAGLKADIEQRETMCRYLPEVVRDCQPPNMLSNMRLGYCVVDNQEVRFPTVQN
jgi:hypothetical protein